MELISCTSSNGCLHSVTNKRTASAQHIYRCAAYCDIGGRSSSLCAFASLLSCSTQPQYRNHSVQKSRTRRNLLTLDHYIQEIANRLYNLGGYLCEKEQQGRIPSWQDWVFMESKRRFVVYSLFITSLLS